MGQKKKVGKIAIIAIALIAVIAAALVFVFVINGEHEREIEGTIVSVSDDGSLKVMTAEGDVEELTVTPDTQIDSDVVSTAERMKQSDAANMSPNELIFGKSDNANVNTNENQNQNANIEQNQNQVTDEVPTNEDFVPEEGISEELPGESGEMVEEGFVGEVGDGPWNDVEGEGIIEEGQIGFEDQPQPLSGTSNEDSDDESDVAAPEANTATTTSDGLTSVIWRGMTITAVVGKDNIVKQISVTSAGPNPVNYDAAYAFDADAYLDSQEYVSRGTDEIAVLVDAPVDVSLTNSRIGRASDDSTGGDLASFFGVGSALLCTDGKISVSTSEIVTNADGAAGAFAYGQGAVYLTDTTIKTMKDSSGGVHVAGGATLGGEKLEVSTEGESSAAIRSDRGGGKMTLSNSKFMTKGIGSPAIYSTADIAVNDSSLVATSSEAICVEGKNSVSLSNCEVSGNLTQDQRNDVSWNVILYQSMSGDAEQGKASFEMTGGKLTADAGGMFYTTNTESTFVIDGVELVPSADNPFLLRCTGNANKRGWGKSGSNGAQCSFTARNQQMVGNVIWDTISKLDMKLEKNSTLSGAFIVDDVNAGQGGNGYAALMLEEGSTWIVTGDSFLSRLDGNGTIVDEAGAIVRIVDATGNVLVEGDGAFTVTLMG